MIKKISLVLLITLYFIAGINHFLNPNFYIRLIPTYLPYPELLNSLAGFFEILFSLGLILPNYRKWAVYGILLMLIAFIPSHIYMLTDQYSSLHETLIPKWTLWIRLLLIQPFLLFWAYQHRKG